MSLFLLLIASVCTAVLAAMLFVTGQGRRASRVLIWWGIGVAAYAGVLVVAGMNPRDLVFQAGAPFCDDDLCGSIESITRTPVTSGEVGVRLGFRLFSRANRGPRSAKGVSLYLSDQRDRRFFPVRGSSVIPFDVAIQPGQSLDTSLSFKVPSNARSLFFNAGVDRVQYASFVIGNGDLLGRPRIRIRI